MCVYLWRMISSKCVHVHDIILKYYFASTYTIEMGRIVKFSAYIFCLLFYLNITLLRNTVSHRPETHTILTSKLTVNYNFLIYNDVYFTHNIPFPLSILIIKLFFLFHTLLHNFSNKLLTTSLCFYVTSSFRMHPKK